MRPLDSHNLDSKTPPRLFLVLIFLIWFAPQSVSGQQACPPPPGYVENPLSTPSITAAEVAANPTAGNLKMFALAARDYLFSVGYGDQLQLTHAFCFLRQEGGDWRSGGIFPIAMSFNPGVLANRQAPIDMRVFLHASTMALGGRIVNPQIAQAILLAAANDFDRSTGLSSGGPVPGLGGHALLLGPYVLLVGLNLQEPHMDPRFIDSHHIPQVTAREVVDRASLKVFVNEAIDYIGQLSETRGFDASQAARGAFRDPNGPWISGPVYLFMFSPAGYSIFHGAFPDRFEYRVTGTARDAVTGELILPQILAAAEQEGGGFVEYHFDNPDDDSDSAEIPKVTYARKFIYSYQHPLLARPVSRTFILAAGFYPGAGTGSGIKMTRSCADRGIAAGAVQTLEDIQPFVECAAEYLAEHGTEEARRAFNEDERWKHGPTYVFVDGIAESGTDAQTLVFPPDPSLEGQPLVLGEAIDDYGTDLFYEIHRMMSVVDSGWTYYSFPNPATGRKSPKASYVIEVDWDGTRAVIGAGLYARDLPGTCYPDEVSAAVLDAASSPQTLREFVRCAAMMVESEGYFSKEELERNARWADGENYVFVLDTMGNQLISGSPARMDGKAPHEWGSRGAREDQFGGRDLAAVADTFGEAHVYYRSYNPQTGAYQPKVGFLKRVDAQGVGLLVGAGYYYDPDQPVSAANPSGQSGRVVVEGDGAMLGDDDFVLNRAAISGDALTISASYGGGCRTHKFTLVIAASFVESSPVRLPAVVRHEANGDPCEAWLTESYTFDLALVRERYREVYGPGAGRVALQLDGVDEDSLVYEFTEKPAGVIPELPGPGSLCADNSVTAAGVRTRSDVQAFVRCAAEYAMEHGAEEARRAFNEDERWKQGPTYVFVDGIAPSGEEAFSYVFPPDPAREGMVWGESIDGFGSDYYYELHRILSLADEGWIYYAFTNPATGQWEPKSSYVIEVDWNGERAAVGAGIYAPDFPGACEPEEVHAAALRGNADDRKLREFVNCAALTVETSGYFAGPALSSDPRWKQGPIFVFGINAETGTIAFSGDESSFAASGRIPELFDGRDAVEAAAIFGEGFWYYNSFNPATQQMEPKVSFVKLVRAEGVPLLVGSGHRPVLRRYRSERTGN